jgi:cytidine deaminase
MQISDVETQRLIKAAISSLDASHIKNPKNLRFGAAVLTEEGNIYVSSAFWSDTLTLALHAEQAALAHAAAHDHRRIVAVCCVSTEDEKGEKLCHPCGMCKQLLYENWQDSGIDLQVVMANRNGGYLARRISEMTLFPWP